MGYEYRVEIQKPDKQLAGLYKCQVKNSKGQMQVYLHFALPTKATLAKRTTKNAPTFLETPRIISLNNGKSVLMIAKYQAKEQCYCAWSKKGSSISESKTVKIVHNKTGTNCYEYIVEIKEVNKSTSGMYKCLIANDNGQMQVYLNLDLKAKRKTKDAPTFSETPKIIKLNNGNLIQMIARYHAKEQSYCTWSKKGASICESNNVKIFHKKIDANLYEYRVEILGVTKSMAGLYKCLVANDNGQMQIYLHLDVKTQRRTKNCPTFEETPKIVSMSNGSVQMIARYQAKEQSYCTWSKKGFSICESKNVKICHKKVSKNSFEHRVEIKEPNRSMAGLYKCLVANGDGQMQVYLDLNLGDQRSKKVAPVFDEIPKIITLDNGKLVLMIARYQAFEKSNCTWSKKGKALSESQNVKISHEKINTNCFEYRAEIHKPDQKSAGLYKCQVKNGNGQTQVYLHFNIETKATLAKRKTKDTPTFLETPRITLLNNGKSVQMIAKYQAKEQCYCNWSKKGSSISENKKMKIVHKKI